MSGRLFFNGALSLTSGFGLAGSNLIIPDDSACIAIGANAEVSHVFVQGSNMHQPFLVGVDTPFIGAPGGRIPFILKAPIVVTPYLVTVGSYKMDLFYYDEIPRVVPMRRGPIVLTGTGQLGAQWCHGRKSIRYFIHNVTGSGNTSATVSFAQAQNAGGSSQDIVLTVASGVKQWFVLSSIDPTGTTAIEQGGGLFVPDTIKIVTTQAPTFHKLEMFD